MEPTRARPPLSLPQDTPLTKTHAAQTSSSPRRHPPQMSTPRPHYAVSSRPVRL